MMLYKNNLNVTFTTPSSKYIEFIVADLNTNKSLSKIRIICVYISPNTASNSANVENFCSILYNYVCVNFLYLSLEISICPQLIGLYLLLLQEKINRFF